MKIEIFQKKHILAFLQLAAQAGWIAEEWEFHFTLSSFPQGCFVATDQGTLIGFVTSFRHQHSGWIGNLIVDPEWRGKGVGEQLFLEALESLRGVEVETIWLTASKMGKGLYERHGFIRIDTINRWTGCGKGDDSGRPATEPGVDSDIDHLGWGDRRDELLEVVTERGRVVVEDDAFVVLQPCGAGVQLGPFAAVDPLKAEILLQKALYQVSEGRAVYLDAPAGNLALFSLLQRQRFRIQGQNELMYAGLKPEYRPAYIYGLASMGSLG